MTVKKNRKQTAVKPELESLVKDLETIRSGLSSTYEHTAGDGASGAYYRDSERTLHFNGVWLMGEGLENISWPGTANVVYYQLHKEGVSRLDVFLGEENWESLVMGKRLLSVPEFVAYAGRRKGNLQKVKDNIEEYRASIKP